METITEKQITDVLLLFYEKVRIDPVIGPVFWVVADWDEHILRLSEFWSSLMLTSGRYKGNPMSMHLLHADQIKPEMFNRWLELWRITTSELLAPAIAGEMQTKALRIAARLSFAVCGTLPPNPVGASELTTPALRGYCRL